jgi:hypothetical protein
VGWAKVAQGGVFWAVVGGGKVVINGRNSSNEYNGNNDFIILLFFRQNLVFIRLEIFVKLSTRKYEKSPKIYIQYLFS